MTVKYISCKHQLKDSWTSYNIMRKRETSEQEKVLKGDFQNKEKCQE